MMFILHSDSSIAGRLDAYLSNYKMPWLYNNIYYLGINVIDKFQSDALNVGCNRILNSKKLGLKLIDLKLYVVIGITIQCLLVWMMDILIW